MPGMTDRDHFAAAALTGLLFHNHEPPKPALWWVEQAFDYADAMLRERAKTNHDAAPAARAAPESVGTDKAEPLQGLGTGDTPEPVAWAAIRENGQPLWLSYDRSGAEGMVNGMAEVFPLYRKPTLSDAEREALEFSVAHGETVDAAWRYALRGLLERMK